MPSRRTLSRTASTLAIAAALGGSPLAATADTLEDLKAQIEALQKRVLEMEGRQRSDEREKADAARSTVTSGATKGSFKLPGSNTSVTLGGYAKLDLVYSNPSAGVDSTADLFLQPNAIPVGAGAGDNEKRQVKLGARETRLFAKTSTPTALGDLVTYVEGDFYGADGNESVSNSHGLRLRHAYGSLGPLLAGQTWSDFMYVPSLPETVDFGGPVGQIFARQAQVRWTHPFDATGTLPGGQWSVALENPESVLAVPGGTSFRADDDRIPDVTAQLVLNGTRGKFALSGLVRDIRADSKAPAVVDDKVGAAISLAGVVPLRGKDDFRFTASAGNAIGRYSNGFFPDGVVDAAGHLELPRQWGWFAAYRHFWTDALRSNVVLSEARESNPADTPGSTNKSTQSAHVNLIWSPVANTDLGLEYIHAARTTEDGQKGRLDRLQASAKYTF